MARSTVDRRYLQLLADKMTDEIEQAIVDGRITRQEALTLTANAVDALLNGLPPKAAVSAAIGKAVAQ